MPEFQTVYVAGGGGNGARPGGNGGGGGEGDGGGGDGVGGGGRCARTTARVAVITPSTRDIGPQRLGATEVSKRCARMVMAAVHVLCLQRDRGAARLTS